jgi:glyoxylase-like metal-dependent hydrolase (beta-lactamase superfamily II)
MSMFRVDFRIAVVALMLGCPSVQAADNTPALVQAAATALGDAQLRAASTLSYTEKREALSAKQSPHISDPLPVAQNIKATVLIDLQGDRVRRNIERTQLLPSNRSNTYYEIFSPQAGFVSGTEVNAGRTFPDGHTMSGMRLTTSLRERERLDVLRQLATAPARFKSAPRMKIDGKSYPSAEFDGIYYKYFVSFDTQSHLPVRIRTYDWDGTLGDTTYDLALTDWSITDGIRFPQSLTYYLGNTLNERVTLSDVVWNKPLADDNFAITPGVLVAAAKPMAPEKTRFQWVIWLQQFALYYDTDQLYYWPDEPGPSLVDIANGVTRVTGISHRMAIVEMPDYLVLFDATVDDSISQWIIEAAKKKFPGKPFKYVVLSHDHEDHIGGLRSFAALGATMVVGPGYAQEIKAILAAPTKLDPYVPNIQSRAKVVEVPKDDKLSITDGGKTINVYHVANKHAAGMVVLNVPDAGVTCTADISIRAGNDNAKLMIESLLRLGVTPKLMVESHAAAVVDYPTAASSMGLPPP